jgi:hypothetical protein
MKKLLKWQEKIVERVSKYDNEEMLDALLDACGNAWSEMGNERDDWEFEYINKKFREIVFS